MGDGSWKMGVGSWEVLLLMNLLRIKGFAAFSENKLNSGSDIKKIRLFTKRTNNSIKHTDGFIKKLPRH